jgi:hypothetical protein
MAHAPQAKTTYDRALGNAQPGLWGWWVGKESGWPSRVDLIELQPGVGNHRKSSVSPDNFTSDYKKSPVSPDCRFSAIPAISPYHGIRAGSLSALHFALTRIAA